MTFDVPMLVTGLAAVVWLLVVAVAKPRLLTYAVFASVPTQFIFIQVSTFFVSPADVAVLAAAAGLVVRLAAGSRRAWTAVWQHRYLGLLILAYLFGFLVLGVFSRTLVRVVMAIVPAILACELLRQRQHISTAAGALIVAAVIDAGYGLAWYLQGTPLHSGRFSGMAGVNFTAMIVLTGAAIFFARRARNIRSSSLTGPGALGAIGFATMSQMGVVAMVGAWLYVLRRVVTRRNTYRLAGAAVIVVLIALSSGAVRDRVAGRFGRVTQTDGSQKSSFEIRLMLLLAGWAQFVDSPIIGWGYGGFERQFATRLSAVAGGEGTHNTYLEILAEGGLLAFSCLVLHFLQYGAPLRGAVREIGRHKDTEGAAALVGLPIVLICAALGNVLMHYFFWSVCGLALAYLNLWRREASDGLPRESEIAAKPAIPAHHGAELLGGRPV